ncbi:MAG: hypothetical protein ACREFX_11120 [Opitutaceae bacterium]
MATRAWRRALALRRREVDSADQPDDGDLGNGLILNDEPPYRYAMRLLVHRHPELSLTIRQTLDLQKRYDALWEERGRREAALARVTPVDSSENLVEIPAFPGEQKRMFGDFAARLVEEFDAATSLRLSALIEPMFISRSGPGSVPETLRVIAVHGEPYDYKVVRQVDIVDPATGKRTGSATGIDDISFGASNPYALQPNFFPPRQP